MKKGDAVTVLPRDLFRNNSKYKHTYTATMTQFAGQIFTISEKYNDKGYYRLKGDEGFIWHEDWLALENNFLTEEEMQL